MLKDVVIANKSYTKLCISDKSGVDQTALKVMKQDCPDFLLPIRTMEVDGELEFRYELLEGVRLSYSSMEMSKKDFVTLLKNMLIPFRICNDWFLDYHNILLDPNYILIGRNGMAVRYVYIPVEQFARSDKEILDFFCDYIIRADVVDDPRFVTNLLRIIKRDESNLMTLLDYITQEKLPGTDGIERGSEPREPLVRETMQNSAPIKLEPQITADMRNQHGKPSTMKKETPKVETVVSEKAQTSGFAGRFGGTKPSQTAGSFGAEDVTGRLVGNLFGDEDDEQEDKGRQKNRQKKSGLKENNIWKGGGNSLFGRLKSASKNETGQEKPQNYKREEPAFKPMTGSSVFEEKDTPAAGGAAYYEDDKTEISVSDADNVINPGRICLQLESSGGRDDCPAIVEIDLTKGYATVGRLDKAGHGQSDYNFDSSFTFISRRHFRVEQSQDGWRIIDLESANGTFLNGQALAPNIPYPLNSGDRIMISQKHRLTYRVR